MKRFFVLLLTFAASWIHVYADEGMWLPSLIESRIKDMKSKGFRLTSQDIYSINKASLKDGIVLFNRGCTGELVSSEGLLLTNHHCGYGQIQKHSSLENDYLTNGFWAMSRNEELPNPGTVVSFLVKMEDVTKKIKTGITESMPQQDANKIISDNIKMLVKQATEGTHYSASVESLYYGNQYFLFIYETFRDIRLVGAPPSSIGKFGGDTDNWMWPRHTGDFSIFRIYADKDNKPADYSTDNVPYKPKKFFTVSTKGVKNNDFTFVYGFPGSTKQYVISDLVDYTLNYSNPAKIDLRTMRLNIINAAQADDPAIRIMYASKAASISNAWKKWQGESLGLKRLNTINKKREYEARFEKWAVDKPEYKDILSMLHKAYNELLPYATANDYYNEAFRAVEIITPANDIYQRKIRNIDQYKSFYKDYSPEIDRNIAKTVMARYLKDVPADFIPERFAEAVKSAGGVGAYIDKMFDNSPLTTLEGCSKLLQMDENNIQNLLENDPIVMFNTDFVNIYTDKIQKEYIRLNNEIVRLYHIYMRGQMEFEPEKDFYPDANLTLRVAYGKAAGYSPDDAVNHLYYTTIDGIIEKDNPDIYDYNIPQKLREIYAARDYGRWGINIGTKKNPHYTVPVAFIASNHTTGGNSGSPLLNARGELIGINFDRTWLSTMSDLEFDPEICRNISVDIRFVLFVIEKIGGAGYLFKEMTFSN